MGKKSLNVFTLPLWWYTTGFNIAWGYAKECSALNLKRDQDNLAIVVLKVLTYPFRIILITSILLGYFLILPATVLSAIYTIIP